uniref:SFRICE_004659 n=1 Tax=Spodoptera frugiperda TaxID=7108 RepID=A0A2H1V928_SPOFR
MNAGILNVFGVADNVKGYRGSGSKQEKERVAVVYKEAGSLLFLESGCGLPRGLPGLQFERKEQGGHFQPAYPVSVADIMMMLKIRFPRGKRVYGSPGGKRLAPPMATPEESQEYHIIEEKCIIIYRAHFQNPRYIIRHIDKVLLKRQIELSVSLSVSEASFRKCKLDERSNMSRRNRVTRRPPVGRPSPARLLLQG